MAALGSEALLAHQDERWRLAFLTPLCQGVSAGEVWGGVGWATNLELVTLAQHDPLLCSARLSLPCFLSSPSGTAAALRLL